MSIDPNLTLYAALAFYAVGTVTALLSLFVASKRLQKLGLVLMIGGFASHTYWIGTICAATGHPPLTNMAEVASFVGWTLLAVEIVLWVRYRVYAASFFVYPAVLLLLTISAIAGENFAPLDPSLRSNLFTGHLLLTTVGVAGLFIGVAFTLLAFLQDRALKRKTRGPLWEWIPNLNVCKVVSYRALTIGFSIYTLGLIAGVIWSYRTTAGLIGLQVKQIGAVTAWVLFGALLQSYISGSYRQKRVVVLSVCAFAATVIAILGIRG